MRKTVLALVAALAIFTSCSSDDQNSNEAILSDAQIPAEIKAYVSLHFESNPISRAVKDSENNTLTYDIYLNGNIDLEFNEALDVIEIDSAIQLPNSVVPQSILDYVSANYPNSFITDWELEPNYQQVKLNNNLELEFEMSGDFIRIDND